MPNTPIDFAQGIGEDYLKTYLDSHIMPGTTEGLKWLGREFLKGLITEEANELPQETRQQAVEQAVKKTLKSGNMSLGNFLSNLYGETLKPNENTELFGIRGLPKIVDYFKEVGAETAASTAFATALLAPFGRSGAGGSTITGTGNNAQDTLQRASTIRDRLQEELNKTQSEADTPEAQQRINDMQFRLDDLNKYISDLQDEIDTETLTLYPDDEDTSAQTPTETPQQDEQVVTSDTNTDTEQGTDDTVEQITEDEADEDLDEQDAYDAAMQQMREQAQTDSQQNMPPVGQQAGQDEQVNAPSNNNNEQAQETDDDDSRSVFDDLNDNGESYNQPIQINRQTDSEIDAGDFTFTTRGKSYKFGVHATHSNGDDNSISGNRMNNYCGHREETYSAVG